MKKQLLPSHRISLAATALLLVATSTAGLSEVVDGHHLVDGVKGIPGNRGLGVVFNLVAESGYISTPEGNSLYFWGYGVDKAQYSGPTLIVNQGDDVVVALKNKLPVPTSITFPGQLNVTATGISGPTSAGLITQEAGAAGLDGTGGGVVWYSFKASEPGTYLYHSGTHTDLQTEMGLVGALIIRPAGFDPSNKAARKAYNDIDIDGTGPLRADSAFDQEFLFLLSDMDDKIHDEVEKQVQAATSIPAGGLPIDVDMSKRFAVYWFMNGRCAPDTMLEANHPSLEAQPYDCFPIFHPAEKILMRVIGGGSDAHPLHHHGNHARIIAQDGRLMQSPGASGADLGTLEFTASSTPGATVDTIFSWTGAGLGWDPYGHKAGEPPATNPDGEVVEDLADHGKPFPVTMPAEQHIVNGMMYGGSPFLGSPGKLPPGEGGFNPNNGFMYLWHSHAEKEIVNNDIFPGGMLTLALIEAWSSTTP